MSGPGSRKTSFIPRAALGAAVVAVVPACAIASCGSSSGSGGAGDGGQDTTFSGQLLVTIEDRFSCGRDAPAGHARHAHALGVLDTPAQSATIRTLMEEEMVPALDRLGLGASHAWKLRRRFDGHAKTARWGP